MGARFSSLGLPLLSTIILLTASAPAHAQGRAYGIAGLGGYGGWFGGGAFWHAAGGGEWLVGGRAGPSVETGIFGNTSGGIGLTSFNGVVHFAASDAPTSPFLTGGYSRFSNGEGEFHAFNVGLGADFWGNARAGLRAEIRDHVRHDARGTVHYISIRAGIVLK